jgi:hypothetical protein
MSRKRHRKTAKMQLLEAKDDKERDIKQIMLDAYRKTGSEAKAAHLLDITQQAYNGWKYRLKLEKQVDEIAFHLKYGTEVTDSDDNENGQAGKGESHES